jgi:hypothetical protein
MPWSPVFYPPLLSFLSFLPFLPFLSFISLGYFLIIPMLFPTSYTVWTFAHISIVWIIPIQLSFTPEKFANIRFLPDQQSQKIHLVVMLLKIGPNLTYQKLNVEPLASNLINQSTNQLNQVWRMRESQKKFKRTVWKSARPDGTFSILTSGPSSRNGTRERLDSYCLLMRVVMPVHLFAPLSFSSRDLSPMYRDLIRQKVIDDQLSIDSYQHVLDRGWYERLKKLERIGKSRCSCPWL